MKLQTHIFWNQQHAILQVKTSKFNTNNTKILKHLINNCLIRYYIWKMLNEHFEGCLINIWLVGRGLNKMV